MLRFSELRELPVDGPEGAGHVVDLHFDDRSWRATSMVLEEGHWPRSHRVVVAAEDVAADEAPAGGAQGRRLRVREGAVLRQVDAELPVSKQMELKYHDYLRWLAYWINGFAVPYDPAIGDAAAEAAARDAHLRSAAAIIGHHVLARDGDAGRVDDYVIDPSGWSVRDLVVHAGVWPHVREALLSPYWVSDVSWARGCVDVHVPRERVLSSAAE